MNAFFEEKNILAFENYNQDFANLFFCVRVWVGARSRANLIQRFKN